MGKRPTTDLVVTALAIVLPRRQPGGDLVHHADLGSQYTSLAFTNRLGDWKINASCGSTGHCFDDAAMESARAAIKRDLLDIYGRFERCTRSQMRTILFGHIEVFYNRRCHQARLKHRTHARPDLRFLEASLAHNNHVKDRGSTPDCLGRRVKHCRSDPRWASGRYGFATERGRGRSSQASERRRRKRRMISELV